MNKYKYQRIFLMVMDSVGIGALPDAKDFGDEGSHTLLHVSQKMKGLSIPTLNSLGLGSLAPILGTQPRIHPHAIVTTAKEVSAGKDTMTGHWEIMGLKTTKPFKTFTDKGFPPSLIQELTTKTGHQFIGNIAASGTEIIKNLGEEHIRTKALIVYTSADSVLQIAAHEKVIPLAELYHVCEIARDICLRPEYRLGRIIARPFIGDHPSTFKRTPNRHDYALSPTQPTVMDYLKTAGKVISCIGKISDIFNGQGVTHSIKTLSNSDGMQKTMTQIREGFGAGLYFINLVDFDSEFGHRRDPIGYGKALELFDRELQQLLPILKQDDLLIITADHGNDPTHLGTDHTRERVPVIMYSPSIHQGKMISERESFADMGQTILANFKVKSASHLIGNPIIEVLK
jgi:phosphopentomutase